MCSKHNSRQEYNHLKINVVRERPKSQIYFIKVRLTYVDIRSRIENVHTWIENVVYVWLA